MSDEQEAKTDTDGALGLVETAAVIDGALTSRGENRVKQWLLLTGSRLSVAVLLLAVVFVTILVLARVWPLELRALLTETDAAKTLFATLLSGAILLVSVVVSINSIVLSQEITGIENQQARVAATIDYRRHIEDFIQADVTPARPGEFLAAVLFSISQRTAALRQVADGSANERFARQVSEFSDEVSAEIGLARDHLEGARVGSFNVLMAGLNYNYSGQLHAARGLKRNFDEELTDEEVAAIDDVIDVLQHVATGREYFKSLYHKRELARLSSILLYVSLPVIVFTSYVILALDANVFPEVEFLGFSPLLISVTVAYAIALAPYVVLTAFVVRTATITLRTLSAGPFILQSGSELRSFEWEQFQTDRDWEGAEASEGD